MIYLIVTIETYFSIDNIINILKIEKSKIKSNNVSNICLVFNFIPKDFYKDSIHINYLEIDRIPGFYSFINIEFPKHINTHTTRVFNTDVHNDLIDMITRTNRIYKSITIQ